MTIANDFHWAITSPNLTDQSWLCDWPVDLDVVHHIYRQLEHQPEYLQQTLGQPIARRLGHYFEQLWHLYWVHDPASSVLGHSMQVIDGKHTIGEADFLIAHNDDVLHIELACKFYLQFQDHWLGPNVKDSWQQKTLALQSKQLRLFEHDSAKRALDQLGLPLPTRSIALCKGRMFSPGRPFFWCFKHQLPALGEQDYRILQRQEWLGEVISGQHCLADLLALSVERPICIAIVENHRETSRFFIVPNHWPNMGARDLSNSGH